MRQGPDERMAVTAALASMLTALSLSPLVAGHTWLFVAAITVITVMVSGIIARQLMHWWVPVAAVQTVVFLVTLLVLFARSRITEGPLGIGVLVDLLRSGFEVTRTQAPPVEATQGIVLLVAGSAGLVALLVDVLAVSLHQPALAGLPLLAVYCVPAALISGGLPWYYFLAAAAGFLVLLAADSGDRVRSWGRVLSAPGGRGGIRAFDAGLARGGRRIGAVTAVVAVLLPALLPGLSGHLLGSNGSGDGKGKGRTITRINPILNLKSDLTQTDNTVLLRYKTTNKNPAPLRIVTADEFSGDVWQPSTNPIPSRNQATNGLPTAPGLNLAEVSTSPVTTQIKVGDLKQTYLPLPYPATKVDAPGSWLYDENTLNVIGDGQTTQDLNYTVTSLDVEPTAEQLEDAAPPGANVTPYLTLPVDMPKSITQLAGKVSGVTEGATPYQEAIRLQRWFRSDGGFTYSTNTPDSNSSDSGLQAIEKFLQVKQGYCVHFASAMAIMARSLGIPARVAVGFLPGTLDKQGWYEVTAHDAHAWPELYFEGVGWVRFEPTPRSGVANPAWTDPPAGVMPEDQTPSSAPSAQASSAPSTTPSARASKDQAEGQVAHATTSSGVSLPWKWIVIVLVLLALAAAPKFTAGVTARRRWGAATSSAALAEAAWEDLRRGLSDLGVSWVSAWTPRAAQHRLAADHELDDAATAALGRLTQEVEDARYAPPGEDLGRSAGERRGDVQAVLAAVARELPTGRRWLARLWPPSGIAAMVAVGTWMGSRADRAGAQVSSLGSSVRDKVGSGRR